MFNINRKRCPKALNKTLSIWNLITFNKDQVWVDTLRNEMGKKIWTYITWNIDSRNRQPLVWLGRWRRRCHVQWPDLVLRRTKQTPWQMNVGYSRRDNLFLRSNPRIVPRRKLWKPVVDKGHPECWLELLTIGRREVMKLPDRLVSKLKTWWRTDEEPTNCCH